MLVAVFLGAIFLYIVFAAALLYFCVFADPETSPYAKYLSQTLPARVWDGLGRFLGKDGLRALSFLSERLLIIVYCAVVFGAWSVIFFYVYPWVDRQSVMPKYHKFVGYIVFASCVASWRLASTSSPGIITAKTINRYEHYPYDNILFVSGQVCKTRKIPKLARSKYDRLKYYQNVPRYDHFCGWVYNTIGEENYRYFLLFLLVHVGMCAYGTFVMGYLFHGEIVGQNLHKAVFVDRFTGEEFPADKWIIVQFLLNKFLCESAVFLLIAVSTYSRNGTMITKYASVS